MITKVKKRDGRIVDYDSSKIVNAILKAFKSLGMLEGKEVRLANKIEAKIKETAESIPEVEFIQDMVEKELMASNFKNVAKEFILYREKRNRERERDSALRKEILSKIECTNVMNQNANVDEESFGGRKFESAAVIHKDIALNDLMSSDVAKAHKEARIYIHDLDSYSVGMQNCLFADLVPLLTNGFITRNGDVRGAGSFSTACQLVAVIFQAQSQCQFGGIASAHIDRDLAPFVKKSFVKHFKSGMKYVEQKEIDKELYYFLDFLKNNEKNTHIDNEVFKKYEKAYEYANDMLEREGKQSAEAMYHNLNTLESRPGSQLPFTSINYGLDTTPEGRLVTKWLLNASIEGIGKNHLTPIFPISIFQYKKGVNDREGTPNYDLKKLAIKSLSKRIYPNIVNCDWSKNPASNIDEEMATMGCRTLIGKDRHGMGYKKDGRGNACPVTINLPRIGIRHGICLGKPLDLEGFWKELDEVLDLTEKSLIERFFYMCKQSVKAAPFMYNNNIVADAKLAREKGIYETLKHFTLGFGYIGIAEMCQALFGADHYESKESLDFALKVVEHIYQRTVEASERHNLNFSCYATPAETLAYKYALALKKEFGVIPNVTDREYITNSHHVPVWQQASIFEKLDIEAKFCEYPTAGCITYIEFEADAMKNEQAVEDIMDYAMSIDVPYLAYNFPIDVCHDCGLQSDIPSVCPNCGSNNILRLRRVTGYLTVDYRNFNKGKQKECEDRVKHTKYTKLRYDAYDDLKIKQTK